MMSQACAQLAVLRAMEADKLPLVYTSRHVSEIAGVTIASAGRVLEAFAGRGMLDRCLTKNRMNRDTWLYWPAGTKVMGARPQPARQLSEMAAMVESMVFV